MRVRIIRTPSTVVVDVNVGSLQMESGQVIPPITVFGVFQNFEVKFFEAESGISPEIDKPLVLLVLPDRDFRGRHQGGVERIHVGFVTSKRYHRSLTPDSPEVAMTVAYIQRLQQRLERLHYPALV